MFIKHQMAPYKFVHLLSIQESRSLLSRRYGLSTEKFSGKWFDANQRVTDMLMLLLIRIS